MEAGSQPDVGPEVQAAELIDIFSMLDSWQEKYHFIIDMGKQMPELTEAEKIERNKVEGCQSTVWMVLSVSDKRILHFKAASDSAIVGGLTAILRKLYSDQPVKSVLAFDIEGFMESLGLSQHLSMSRRNGLGEMIKRIKCQAAEYSTET